MAAVPEFAAVYARISDDTEGRAAGVGRQTDDSLALAERLGWSLAPLPPFVDNDISASTRSKARRPAFEDLMRRVQAGEIDGIVYYSSSRLTRRPLEFEGLIELVEKTGVKLASCVSGSADLTTADGRMIARILAAQDAAEAERTGERVKRAFAQRRAEGRPNPSSRVFGFEAGGEVVHDEEAALIREAAHRIAVEGWSLGQVVADWNSRSVPTVRGAGMWNRTQVKRALTSPRTAGLVTQGGVVVGVGTFEGIITADLQAKVQEALTGRRNGATVTYSQRRNVLAGFLVCGKCGKPMKVNALLDEDGGWRRDSYIICSRSQYGCGGVKRNLPVVMDYIDGLVRMRIEGWQPVADAEDFEGEVEEVTTLQRRLMEVEEDIAELQASFNSGGIRFGDYNTALSALRTQQEATHRALETFQVGAVVPEDLDLLAAWEEGEVEERREVLGILIDHIKLLPVGKVGPIRMREMTPLTTEVVWR